MVPVTAYYGLRTANRRRSKTNWFRTADRTGADVWWVVHVCVCVWCAAARASPVPPATHLSAARSTWSLAASVQQTKKQRRAVASRAQPAVTAQAAKPNNVSVASVTSEASAAAELSTDPVADYVKAKGGNRPIRKILVANNGMAAAKCIMSMRRWAYLTFGDSSYLRFVVMATPEDLNANAEFIRNADDFIEVPGGKNSNNYANVNLIVNVAIREGESSLSSSPGPPVPVPASPHQPGRRGSRRAEGATTSRGAQVSRDHE
eukprot:3505202-Pyramimonas_sp.AAC.1